MITAEGIGKTFPDGTVSLSGVAFRLASNEVLGIVGKSGAGKTTLLRILSLQIPPDSGHLVFDSDRIDPGTPRAARMKVTRRTATVFQGFSLLYNISIADNVALPLKLRGVPRDQRLRKAREMLDFAGLGAQADAYPATLSGGEAQRAAIARALITNPELLFLDEPTSALDAQTTRDILDLLKRAQSSFSISMVIVAHDMGVVRYMCDRALYLEGGRMRRLDAVARAPYRPETVDTVWAAS